MGLDLAPGSVIGKYVVRRKIAEGGMAEIYLATQKGPEGFERDLCIKRVRDFLSNDPRFVDMFVAEARLVATLTHPNIVQVFDFDHSGDAYYLAMEFVHGRSLADVRNRARAKGLRMPAMLVAHIGHEVSKGLAYAHRVRSDLAPSGVVHRDVTPHNILISHDGEVKLTDFGIAKVGSRRSVTGSLKGKAAYMSPEQTRGQEVDARTDVFALGIVLWELLTGERLFQGDGEIRVMRAVQESPIASPNQLNPEVPAELCEAVMRALDRDPSRRFSGGSEMATALRRVLFAHAREASLAEVAPFMKDLFSDPSEHTGIADQPLDARPAGAIGLPGLDDDPKAPTLVTAGRIPGPPAVRASPLVPIDSRPPGPGLVEAAVGSGGDSIDATPTSALKWVGILAGIFVAVVALTFTVVSHWTAASRSKGQVPVPMSPGEARVSEKPSPAPPSTAGAGSELAPKALPTIATTPPVGPPDPHSQEPVPLQPSQSQKEPPAPSYRDTSKGVGVATSPSVQSNATLEVTVAGSVFLDGVELGTGPGSWSVSPGSHWVGLMNPDIGLNRMVRVNAKPGARAVVRGK